MMSDSRYRGRFASSYAQEQYAELALLSKSAPGGGQSGVAMAQSAQEPASRPKIKREDRRRGTRSARSLSSGLARPPQAGRLSQGEIRRARQGRRRQESPGRCRKSAARKAEAGSFSRICDNRQASGEARESRIEHRWGTISGQAGATIAKSIKEHTSSKQQTPARIRTISPESHLRIVLAPGQSDSCGRSQP